MFLFCYLFSWHQLHMSHMQLYRWEVAKFKCSIPKQKQLCHLRFPHVNCHMGRDHPRFPGEFDEIHHCRHNNTDIFLTNQKALCYSNTFSQYIPTNPEQLLRTYYGKIGQTLHQNDKSFTRMQTTWIGWEEWDLSLWSNTLIIYFCAASIL